MLRRLFFITPIALLVFIYGANVSAQQNSTFKLRILPKDCIFTVLDAGTQTLFFITPKICEPPPPVNTSTALELPLERLVTYEDASGQTTFNPPESQAPYKDIGGLASDSLAAIGSLTYQLLFVAGWFAIGFLWFLLIFSIAFGMAGFRKAISLVIHR